MFIQSTVLALGMLLHPITVNRFTPRPPIQIYSTLDLTFDIPRFNNAPKFAMDRALSGETGGGNLLEKPPHKVESDRRKQEETLDEIIMWACDPDFELEFFRWRGHLLIRKR